MYLNKFPGAFWDCGGVWGPTKSKPLLEGSFQSATRRKEADLLLKPSQWLREKCVRWRGDKKSIVIRHIYWFLLRAQHHSGHFTGFHSFNPHNYPIR